MLLMSTLQAGGPGLRLPRPEVEIEGCPVLPSRGPNVHQGFGLLNGGFPFLRKVPELYSWGLSDHI